MNRVSCSASVLLLAVGCAEAAPNTHGTRLQLSLLAISSAPDVVALGEPSSGVGIARLSINASYVGLLPCEASAAPISIPILGRDLSAVPVAASVASAPVELCELVIDVDPVARGDVSRSVPTHSLMAEVVAANGARRLVTDESSLSFHFRSKIDGFGQRPLVVGFDVAQWPSSLPLSGAAPELIDHLLRQRAREAFTVHEDTDHDGAIGDGERTPVAELVLGAMAP